MNYETDMEDDLPFDGEGGIRAIDSDTRTMKLFRKAFQEDMRHPRPDDEFLGRRWDYQKEALEELEQELEARGNVYYLYHKNKAPFI